MSGVLNLLLLKKGAPPPPPSLLPKAHPVMWLFLMGYLQFRATIITSFCSDISYSHSSISS